MSTAHVNDNVRYELDEHPPNLVTIGSGFQAAMLIVAPVVLTVVIMARIADQPESYIAWGAFAALIVSGITTILQAVGSGESVLDTSSSWARQALSFPCVSLPW